MSNIEEEQENGRHGRHELQGGETIPVPKVFYRIDRNLARFVDPLGNLLVDIFHYVGLFVIGAATVWAAAYEFTLIFQKGHATVADLLLLFIYLEIGAMVGIYFRTSRLPVRFLVYVAVTALTRLLIGEVGKLEAGKGGNVLELIYIGGAVLVLALALLLLRYGSSRFPSSPSDYQSQLRRTRDEKAGKRGSKADAGRQAQSSAARTRDDTPAGA